MGNIKKIVASWIFAHCLYEVYRARKSEDPKKKVEAFFLELQFKYIWKKSPKSAEIVLFLIR